MSLVSAIRDRLVEWAEAFDWSELSGTLTVTSEAPRPEDLPDLPTLALWFRDIQHEHTQPRPFITADDDAVGWLCGEQEADLMVLFRLGSFADAEVVRTVFPRTFIAACTAGFSSYDGLDNESTSNNVIWKVRLDWDEVLAPSTIASPETTIAMSIYWPGNDTLATPEQTGVRDLYELRYTCNVAYPWVERADPPDRFEVSLENEEPDGSTFEFDLNDLG